MLDEEKVHEMVIVAIERDWHVIEKHIDRIHELIAEIIRRRHRRPANLPTRTRLVASRCFGAATVNLCHPQMVAQCLAKTEPGNARRTRRISRSRP